MIPGPSKKKQKKNNKNKKTPCQMHLSSTADYPSCGISNSQYLHGNGTRIEDKVYWLVACPLPIDWVKDTDTHTHTHKTHIGRQNNQRTEENVNGIMPRYLAGRSNFHSYCHNFGSITNICYLVLRMLY